MKLRRPGNIIFSENLAASQCLLYVDCVFLRRLQRVKNSFKIGQRLEAVDLEEPFMVRVATIFNVIGRILLLLFDGHNKFQYVDYESEDIYPIGWCMKTGHPLSTQHGISKLRTIDYYYYYY